LSLDKNIIIYAAIYLSPYAGDDKYLNIYYPADVNGHKLKTMVHELGHALGFGEVDSNYGEDAIMKQRYLPYSWPQPYDISEVNRKYAANALQ